MITALNSLKPKANSSRWSTLRHAIKSILKAGRLEELESQLNRVRGQVLIRFMASINAKVDLHAVAQSNKLEKICRGQEKIVEVMTLNTQAFAGLVAGNADIIKPTGESSNGAGQISDGIRELILELDSGHTLSMKLDGSPRRVAHSIDPRTLDCEYGNLVESEQNRANSLHCVAFNAKDARTLGTLGQIKDRVLDLLHFRQISDRKESIKSAHENTFRWVLDETIDPSESRTSLSQWIETGNGIYWINGKGGSGKSTLMKLILEDTRTLEYLERWSNSVAVLTPSFYFWYAGSTMQKSQSGLLRSLLFQVLGHDPTLIPLTMPDFCRSLSKMKGRLEDEEPTLAELKRWFKQIIRLSTNKHYACFFIDGLDEFDGNCADLTAFFLEISSISPSVKFILSSRPLSSCAASFAKCPGLRLQDLTRQDIHAYAYDLLDDPLKQILGSEETSTSILEEIVEKSSGVFLWVYMTTKSLIEGIQDGDSLSELRKRLSELPPDLNELYLTMFRRIPARYLQDAGKLVKLILASRLIESDVDEALLSIYDLPPRTDVSLLQLSFAMENSSDVRDMPYGPVSESELARRYERMQARLRSRCLGLLETYDTRKGHGENVQFIHRTANEFFTGEHFKEAVGGSWKTVDFNEFEALTSSCIAIAKLTSPSKTICGDEAASFVAWQSLVKGLAYASVADGLDKPVQFRTVEALNEVASYHWASATSYLVFHPTNPIPFFRNTSGHWSGAIFSSGPEGDIDELLSSKNIFWFLRQRKQLAHFPFARVKYEVFDSLTDSEGNVGFTRVAILFGLGDYVKAKLPIRSTEASKLLAFLVWYPFLAFNYLEYAPWTSSRADICEALLRSGADVNYPAFKGFTTWTIFISSLAFYVDAKTSSSRFDDNDDIVCIDDLQALAIERMLKAFISNGADVEATIKMSGRSWQAITVLESLMIQLTGPENGDIRSAIRRSQAFSQTRLSIVEKNSMLEMEQDDRDWVILDWHNLRELF